MSARDFIVGDVFVSGGFLGVWFVLWCLCGVDCGACVSFLCFGVFLLLFFLLRRVFSSLVFLGGIPFIAFYFH